MTDKRDPPSGTENTIAAPLSGTEPTIAPPVSATQHTLAEDTRVSKPGSSVRSKGSIGEEMQGASIERFGRVSRDRFELLDELARGGLGRVFRARDPRTNRIVAIKEVLRPQGDIIARFAREAMVTANLQHPAIVPVYEVGRWETGEPFYAMKLVQGRTLEALIGETASLDARIGLVPHLIVVADALAYAHSERVIHRDLKPANVIVGAYGETVVIDWGLAKNLATGEEIDVLPHATTLPPDNNETVLGAVVGTPAYMPPEQALGEKVDEHADVYAIGAMLYHVLAGVRPYRQARTMDELLELVTTRRPQPIAELAPDAPPELIAIAEKAMAPRAADRYATAQGLAHDLRAYQAGKLVAAHRYTTWQLIRRWIGQHRGTVLTASVALGVMIAIGAVGVWRIARERDVAQQERAEAQRQRGIAEKRVADSLEELARQALIAGTPDKALPLLVGAVEARAQMTPTAEIMTGVARAAYDGLVGIAPSHVRGTTSGGIAHGGAWTVTAGTDGELRAYDVAARREVWSMPVARLAALSPDGAAVLGVDGTNHLSVLGVADHKLLHEWRPDGAASNDVAHVLAWSHDGGHFAAGTPGGRVFLGAPTSPTLASLDPHKGNVWAAAFSPNGALLATGGDDGVLAVRDTASGKLVTPLADGASQIATIVWLDDAHVLTGDDKGIARVWSLADKRVVRRFAQGAAIYGIVLGGTARRWAAVFGTGTTVSVIDPATGALIAKLPGHVYGTDVAAAANDRLVTTDETGNTFVWDAITGERLQTLPNEGLITGVSVDGDRAMVFGNGRVRVWELARDRQIVRIPGHTARIRDLAWSADGLVLWSASLDGTARGVELATGKAIQIGTGGYSEPPITALPSPPAANPHGLRSLTLSPDGKYIATAAEDGTLALTELANPAHRISLAGHTGRVRRLVFARDQRTAYSVGDTTLRVWDVATGAQRGSVALGGPGWDVALFANDSVVATQDEQTPNVVALWRAADLKPIPTHLFTRLWELPVSGDHLFIGSETEIDAIDAQDRNSLRRAFVNPVDASITGDRVIVAGTAGDLALFGWPDLAPIRSWRTGGQITTVRSRADGMVVATATGSTVQLWDPQGGRLLAEHGLPVLVSRLAWSPDGTHLAIAGGSGTIWVWNFAPVDRAALAPFARCVSPWRLDDTTVVAAPFDPATCSVLAH